MRAIACKVTGEGDVLLNLTDRQAPGPGPGEVLVRVAVSAVNPTGWKARRDGKHRLLDVLLDLLIPGCCRGN